MGYWSDKHLYPGDMEGADIAFCADGTGWAYWYNAAGGFEVLRRIWRQAGPPLTLQLHEHASGTRSRTVSALTRRAQSHATSRSP